MNPKSLIVGLAVGAVTTWAAGKVVKTLGLPGYATPVVALVVGPFVHKAARTVI